MLKFLKLIDTFPAEDYLTIIHSKGYSKSVFGGIITVIIYVLSFSFFVYSINDWQQDNKLPKITQSSQNSENIQYQQPDTFAQFTFYGKGKQLVDPFDPQNLVIQAMLQIYNGSQLLYQGQVPYSQQKSKMNSYLQILKNVTLSYISDEKSFTSLYYQINFIDCQEKFLNSGQKCANQTVVDNFYLQDERWIVITFFEEQFNTKTKKIEKIPKRNSVYIQKDKTFFQENGLQISSSYIDNGLLFSSVDHQQYLNGVTNQFLEIPKSYSISQIGYNATLIWTIQLGQLYIEQFIEYPKIQEILADIGSIVSIFWLLQYFPMLYNKTQLQQHTLDEIIKIYYPDFHDLKIGRNILNKITEISYKGATLSGQKFEIWKKTYLNLQEAATNKTSFLNLQYEVSRIQLLFIQQLIQNLSSKEMRLSCYAREVANSLDPSMSRVQQPLNEMSNVFSPEANPISNFNDFSIFSYHLKEQKKEVNLNVINVR